MKQRFSRIGKIRRMDAPDVVTPGTLVLEGGAWRGIYTQGALDALMEEGILFETTYGTSAGAMSAIQYLSGQIGYCRWINLTYRRDPAYCGAGAYLRDGGITGFTYLFEHVMKDQFPLNEKRFFDPRRRMIVNATALRTGSSVWFEKGVCPDIFRAIRASATVPYVSVPVRIDGAPYLDGGCSVKIGYDRARAKEKGPFLVIRTREKGYRRQLKDHSKLDRLMYPGYPKFRQAMPRAERDYNDLCDRLEKDEEDGKAFVLYPSQKVEIERFESDLEKLGALSELGYSDMKARMGELKEFLAKSAEGK